MVVIHRGVQAFTRIQNAWDLLSARSPSPFLTHGWLSAWWRAFGDGDPVVVALEAPDGRLRAAALMRDAPFGGLAAAANDHSGDWDAVAEDDAARDELWTGLARLGVRHLTLAHVRADSTSLPAARAALAGRGYRLHATEGNRSPYLQLPADPDALMAGRSRNMRSQVGRRRRQLEQEGAVELRVVRGGETLDRDLDALFAVEASGWKAREGTAILAEPGAEPLYRSFAHAMAERELLRVYLLEVGGTVVAGDLGCAIGHTGFLVKTGFDESWSRLSPGLVLRAEVLRASIEEGLRAYDFLGPDDDYKTRWTDDVRPRLTLRAFRGPVALPATRWHRTVRPALKRARAAAARRRAPR